MNMIVYHINSPTVNYSTTQNWYSPEREIERRTFCPFQIEIWVRMSRDPRGPVIRLWRLINCRNCVLCTDVTKLNLRRVPLIYGATLHRNFFPRNAWICIALRFTVYHSRGKRTCRLYLTSSNRRFSRAISILLPFNFAR